MTSHILSLTALHAAAPGVLDVVFGPDGDFEGAPRFTGPVRSTGGWIAVASVDHEAVTSIHLGIGGRGRRYHNEVALDLRTPTVAARLAGLCWRAAGFAPRHLEDGVADAILMEEALWSVVAPWGWTEQQAARLAALTLALAPWIAALGGAR